MARSKKDVQIQYPASASPVNQEEKIITLDFSYRHIPTVWRFHECKKRIKAILGPFGSAKSSGCIWEIFQNGISQRPNQHNQRNTRWIAVRNTYRQLKDTTMKTFMDWFPPAKLGKWNETDKRYLMEIPMVDETVAQIEILFRALDDPDDVANLLSLDLTGAWINEYREIPHAIFDGIDARIARYPAVKDGGCDYPCIIMDSNPPDYDHWSYKYFEERCVSDVALGEKAEIFHQPSGRSPEAENLPNLPPNYYKSMAVGKDEDWIRVFIDAEYGYVKTGKPVYKNYSDRAHLSTVALKPIHSLPIIIGLDFALNPAAVLCQVTPDGKFNVLNEVFSEGIPLKTFIRDNLRPFIQATYPGFKFICVGDPSGINRSQTDGMTCYGVLKDFGFEARPARTNSFQARFAAVDSLLVRLSEGVAAFRLDPSCKMLHKGFLGEYKFPEHYSRNARGIIVDLTPLKNTFSHPHDALQYACLGYEYIEAARETSGKAYSRRKSKPDGRTAMHAHT